MQDSADSGLTRDTLAVEDALWKAGFEQVRAYRCNSASIRVRVVDRRFENLSRGERVALVEPALEGLPERIQTDIINLTALTPFEAKEAKRSDESCCETSSRLREALAAYAHEAWSGWMAHMFSKSVLAADGDLLVPPELVERWQRQMRMKYEDLSEEEKRSDRREADRILAIFKRKFDA